MFQRIILALNFTTGGRHALQKSVQLARDHGARLLIFHALNYRLMYPDTPDAKIVELTEEAQRKYAIEYKPLLEEYTQSAFNCWEADPAIEVCKLAHDTKADLIIIGCHQRLGGKSITRVGRVGGAILEMAPCPVLLIPCPDEPKP